MSENTGIPRQRAVIDRRALAEEIARIWEEDGAKGNQRIVAALRAALDAGRREMACRLEKEPSKGHAITHGHSFLIDQLVRVIHDHVIEHVYPAANRSTGERLVIMAVGGYGRREMAPHSDVDIAFLTPGRRTAWCEQVIEAMLYCLWDLGLKVGHSSRSLDEMVRMSKEDLTIRTAMLEGRYVWGDQALYAEAAERYRSEVVKGSEREFVSAKLQERNERHRRVGDSRYVVEPNVKEGKGGLRDLQALYWIGKYIHRVQTASELVDVGLFSPSEYRAFRRAEGFLLAVRCHLHTITGRAEDRLTFDLQREVAGRMNFADRTGKSAVERFMQYYFLQARRVGSLTGAFLSKIEEELARSRPRHGLLATFRSKARDLKGYKVFGGRIGAPSDDWFRRDPIRLIEIFQLAEEHELEIQPDTMLMAARDSKQINNALRRDERANELFLSLLAGRKDPETALRWMNEAGVFGRFVPDFGRVNAQMQFDMYHHYTVDEHTIRAIGLLSRIERGEYAEDHPLSHDLIHRISSRRVLYVAVLLHDIAKGRGGDHSVLGAEVAEQLCPRFGMTERETEQVAWLVRHHLTMSATAFKRDLSDAKTIGDFVGQVETLERLRLLLMLTVVDIRAVGPGTWNSWKRQLLGDLYDLSEQRIRLGHTSHAREQRVAAKKEAVRRVLEAEGHDVSAIGTDRFYDSYWIAEAEDIIARNLVHFDAAQEAGHSLSIHCEYYAARGATLVTVIADDHPGLFYRIAGAINLAGANVIDARIHTTRTGKAVDNFLVQDPHGQPFAERSQLHRLKQGIEDAVRARVALVPKLAKRPLVHSRAATFDVRPRVDFDNRASNRFTVVEVSARDRAALLNRLARTLFEEQLVVRSAHITNYGERAVDTFYVTDLLGLKVEAEPRLKKLEEALLEAASDERQREVEAA
ncbi:[protein-PII] uridylyltransferase [Altererythrobacter sp. CAU 1778]